MLRPKLLRSYRTDACKSRGDPTHDKVSFGTGQVPVSHARSATAGTVA